MNLIQTGELLEDAAFVRRVLAAAIIRAGAVIGEPPETVDHVSRLKFARRAIVQPGVLGPVMARVIVATGLGVAASDQEILNAVDAAAARVGDALS